MNIIQAGYEIKTPISVNGVFELKQIEESARLCYKSEDKITDDGMSAMTLITNLIRNGHEAMLEHMSIKVRFYCDRGVSHEIVRHRIASYAQESTRYVNYSREKFGNSINVIDIKNGIEYDTKMKDTPEEVIDFVIEEWLYAMNDAEKHYMRMIEYGATPQIARSVLPTSAKTEIDVTMNYREWRHFLKLRTAKQAHPQMREIAIPLLKELQQRIPIIFDDIKVEE